MLFRSENDNEDLNKLNSKEKNMITVDLSDNEKIVFSQLGINPLIKLGKEYLTSNNFVHLKENGEEKKETSNNKKTSSIKVKKISKSEKSQALEVNNEEDTIDKSTKKIKDDEQDISLENNDDIELTDEGNNSRKKRRRSSAGVE